jgi:hypothetical protein
MMMTTEEATAEAERKAAEQAAALAAAQTDLSTAADTILAGVPDHLKPLIPASLSPKERIDWFAQAKATGIFDRAAVPATDGGVKPTVTPKAPDPASLPAFARIAAGYRK